MAGVVVVGLVVTSIAIGPSSPSTNASAATIRHYWSSHQGRASLQIACMLYAAVFAIVYFASVARYLRSRGADVLAQVIVAGGILMVAGIVVGAGTMALFTDHFSTLGKSDATVQTLNAISEDLWWPLLVVGSTIATLAIGVSALRTRALPKWVGIVAVIDGIGGLSGVGSWFAFMASAIVTLLVAYVVYQRLGQPQSITMPDVPGQRAVAETPASETSKA